MFCFKIKAKSYQNLTKWISGLLKYTSAQKYNVVKSCVKIKAYNSKESSFDNPLNAVLMYYLNGP